MTRLNGRIVEGRQRVDGTLGGEALPLAGITVTAQQGTVVRRNRGVPTGFSRWVAPFMTMAIGRANKKDLALLKRRLENG